MSWARVVDHWQRDVKLWLVLMGILAIFRGVMIGWYGGEMAEGAGMSEIWKAMLTGARFDGRFMLAGVVPSFVMGWLSLSSERYEDLINKVRVIWGTFVAGVTVLLCIGDFGFYGEYHDHYNQWVLGLVYDDPKSLMLTVWHDYPVVILGVLSVVGIWLLYLLLKWFLREPLYRLKVLDRSVWIFVVVALVMLYAVKCVVTCTWDFRNLSRKDTARTGDIFLNKMVYSPYYALYSTCRDYRKRNSGRGMGVFWPSGDVKEALSVLYPGIKGDKSSVLEYMEQVVSSDVPVNKPQHVFLIVMESQDAWPLLEGSAGYHLAPNLSYFAKEGVWVRNFLPAGVGTMPALNSIIMGVPEVGVEAQYQRAALDEMATGIAGQFNGIGYEPRLFYGGYLSWRKLGELAKRQGFKKVYGIGSIKGKSGNEWGVDDRGLYEYIMENLGDKPTFNLIMTTSNHPPYSVDLEAEGFSGKCLPDGCSKQELGHSWYGDKCVGEFVQAALERYPSALFVITGDHWSRRYVDKQPGLYERNAVPLILYGPNLELPKGEVLGAGAHIDIAPTLMHLLAPMNYRFYSMGHDMLNSIDAQIGYGSYGATVTPEKIFGLGDNAVIDMMYNAYHAVGWHRIKVGEAL